MDNDKNQYNGDYTDEQRNDSPKLKKKMSAGKIFLIALLGGMLGGGAIIGGCAIYNHFNSEAVTTDNRKGKTVTSNIKVTETNQATKAFDKVKDAVVSVEAYSSSNNSIDDLFGSLGGDSDNAKEISESEGSGVIYKKSGNTAFILAQIKLKS